DRIVAFLIEQHLRDVGLAERDRAGAAEGGDEGRVAGGALLGAAGHAGGRGRSGGGGGLLGRHGDAGERRQRVAAGTSGVDRAGGRARFFVEREDHGVELRVYGLDARDVGVDHLLRAHLAAADQSRQLGGAAEDELHQRLRSIVGPWRFVP